MMFVSSACGTIGLEIKQEWAGGARAFRTSHLVVCCLGRPASRLRLILRRTVNGRVFAPGWLWRRCAGAGFTALVLQSRLEESGNPLEGRD